MKTIRTKKKREEEEEESSPGWATKITKISVSLQKELATIGSSRDNSRADASRSRTIQENQARSIPSKNRSGSILALLSGASRVPRVSASSRGGPTTMGGWKRDRGTRHGLVLLGYLAERPTMTATSHHHRWAQPLLDGQHLAEWPAHLQGMCMIALSKKGGQPARWNTCVSCKIFLGPFNGQDEAGLSFGPGENLGTGIWWEDLRKISTSRASVERCVNMFEIVRWSLKEFLFLIVIRVVVSKYFSGNENGRMVWIRLWWIVEVWACGKVSFFFSFSVNCERLKDFENIRLCYCTNFGRRRIQVRVNIQCECVCDGL